MKLASIASSSEGNSIYVNGGNTKILVDCGVSAKRIEQSLAQMDLEPGELNGILITHEHVDHIKGLGVLMRRYGLPVFATAPTIDAILEYKNLGEVNKDDFYSIEADKNYRLGDILMNASHIYHDAADPVCYSFLSDGIKTSIATDLGDYDDYLTEKICGSHILFVEANHDVDMLKQGKYPPYLKKRILGKKGHLSNERCAQLLKCVTTEETKKIYLGHLSKENNMEKLAYETVCRSCGVSADTPVEVAKRDSVSSITTLIQEVS